MTVIVYHHYPLCNIKKNLKGTRKLNKEFLSNVMFLTKKKEKGSLFRKKRKMLKCTVFTLYSVHVLSLEFILKKKIQQQQNHYLFCC